MPSGIRLRLARLVVLVQTWGVGACLALAIHLQEVHLEHLLARLRLVVRQHQHLVQILQVLEARCLAPPLRHLGLVVRPYLPLIYLEEQILALLSVRLLRRQVLVALHLRLPLEAAPGRLECPLQRLLLEGVHLVAVFLVHQRQTQLSGQHKLLRLSMVAVPLVLPQGQWDLVLVLQVLALLRRALRLALAQALPPPTPPQWVGRQTFLEHLPLQEVHLVHLLLQLVACLHLELLKQVMGCSVLLLQLHRQVLDLVRQLLRLRLEGLRALLLHLPVSLALQEPPLLAQHFRWVNRRHQLLLFPSLLRQLLQQAACLAQERDQRVCLRLVLLCHLHL